jgi:hypothetical protein
MEQLLEVPHCSQKPKCGESECEIFKSVRWCTTTILRFETGRLIQPIGSEFTRQERGKGKGRKEACSWTVRDPSLHESCMSLGANGPREEETFQFEWRCSQLSSLFLTQFKEIDCAIHKGPIVMNGDWDCGGRCDKWLMDCLRYGDMMLCKCSPCHELLLGLGLGLGLLLTEYDVWYLAIDRFRFR